MRTVKALLLIAAFLGASVSMSEGAAHYVRQGANGTGSGEDWANAYPSLPVTLQRGDAYYVADGTYGSYNFNDATSGTLEIFIKKATEADHGTDTGWNSSYGDGQAIFGPLDFTTDYYTMDGQWVANEFTTANVYGIKVDFDEGQTGVNVSAQHITLQYIDLDGIAATGNYNYTATTHCVGVNRGGNYWTMSHCACHGAETMISFGDGITNNGVDVVGPIVEYSHFYNGRSISPNFHQNVMYTTSATNGIYRYNRMHDYNDEGMYFHEYDGPVHDWKIYGNIAWSDGGENNPRGIELRQPTGSPGDDGSYENMEIYNNTFVNLAVGGIRDASEACSNCIARDNLGYNAPNTLTHFTQDNNTADSTNRFVNLTGKDFHLAGALAGVALGAEFGVDPDGNARGADGVWDRGAYEYCSGGCGTLPPAPTNLKVN